MEGAVHRFARLLRRAGVPVSVSEVVDAAVAAAQPGVLADREVLRHALAVSLVKDRRHLAAFDRVFDLFFALMPVDPPEHGHGHTHDDLSDEGGLDGVTLSEQPAETPEQGHSHGKPQDIRDFFDREDLAQQFNLHQEANKIDLAAMTDEIVLSEDQQSPLGEAARVEIRASRLSGGGLPGDIAAGDRAAMDVELTVAQEAALLDWLENGTGEDDLDPELVADLRRRLGGLIENLPDLLARHLERLMELDGRRIEAGEVARRRDPAIDEAQRAELEEALRRLVRSLRGAPRARRLVSHRGRVDGSRTMRTSMRYDGVPFRPVTVSRAEDRPRLVVLADVSLSVRATARFTLGVVNGLHDLVSQVRSWAFVAEAAEITDLFAEHEPDAALAAVFAGPAAGGPIDVDADSDYGAVFRRFLEEDGSALTRRTTLLVLGDGRGNGHDPGLAAFEELTRRVRETVWLTPEPSYSWALGRCDLPLYAEHCDRVQVVRDVAGLDRLAPAGAR